MKSHTRVFHSTLVLGIVASLAVNPLSSSDAFASQKGEFHTVCDPVNQGGVNADGSSNGGDQAKGECAKAEMAMNASKVEKTKTIVFGAAAAACTAMAVIENLPWSAAAAKIACNVISTGASAGGMLMDKDGASQNGEIVGKFTAGASQIMSYAGAASGLMGGATGLFSNYIKNQAAQGGQAAGEQAAKKVACISSAVILGVQAGLSTAGMIGANKTFNTSIFNAKSLSASAQHSTTQLSFNGPNGGQQGNVAQNPQPTGSTSVVSETCDEKNGNEYIRCMGQLSPELAAIANNPEFLGTMEKALGGKSLGDFAKGFKGETAQEAANYIGSGMGINGDAVAKLMESQQKLAKDTGAMEKYEPLAYTRVGSSSSHISDKAPDFNKMMADMLKQLNPEADVKKNDAAELVFRQMDLLPPEKIEQNKEISLFARVGYRYRKNLVNVEQLNWSRAENQQTSQK